MTTSYIDILPNEMIDRISEELIGIDLFHFALLNQCNLHIANYCLFGLLHAQSPILLTKEIHELITMPNSPYTIDGYSISIVLSPYKWNQFVYGAFKLADLFVIAGGSVFSSLLFHHQTRTGSDIDLYFLKENSQLFVSAVNELELRLQNKYFVQHKTIMSDRLVQFDLFRKFCIRDIFNGNHFTSSVIIQLIRSTTTSTTISQIIHSFDLDICAAAFNSKEVIISFSCLQALNTGHSTCYDIPISTSDFVKRAIRLYKYQQRGFNILCPKEFNIDAFLNTTVEDCKQNGFEQIYLFRKKQFGNSCDSFSIQKKFCEYY
ncbi:unnamed protein product [Adineta steineri]|uniref:Uncharacterized protein n=1 Tax=Adineta steineri TaxID=433720 RepID=A0A815IK32_9BILA|nr:unnamed protein product [Adineta steineri]CAF3839909.1 unnamed protein product [Adineta steineri]